VPAVSATAKAGLAAELVWRTEDGVRLPALLWRATGSRRMISSALVGGGIGPAGWVLNAQVPGDYARLDPADHLGELAARFGLSGPGVGMLTAAAVERWCHHVDGGVSAAATVGLRVPTWAARPDGHPDPELAPSRPGTINIIVVVPVALTDAALVNAVLTATEAKSQALWEAGYQCTGTASDAICVAAVTAGAGEPFAGPRSTWGARIARAVHGAVKAGAVGYAGVPAAAAISGECRPLVR
jgi:adenosylcobinamide amidohydrolase